MNIAIILVAVIVVGAVGYWIVTRSKTSAPIPQGDRAAIAVVQAPGDVKAVVDGAARKAMLAAAVPSLTAVSPARLSLISGG